MKNTILFYCFLIILGMYTSCQNKEEHFIIKANLKNFPDSTLFHIEDLKAGRMIDSAFVINGALTLKGKLDHPSDLVLSAIDPVTNKFIYTKLFIGNEIVSFEAFKEDFPWNIDVQGSIEQDIAEKFNQIEFQRQNILAGLKKSYKDDKEFLSQKINQVSDSLDNVRLNLIKKYFNSYTGVNNFFLFKNRFSTDELVHLYSNLDTELQPSKYGKAIKTQIEFPKPEVGHNYYDYTSTDQYGESITLSHIEGKYILLHFASTACYYSQLSLPEQKRIYQKHQDELEIVKISLDAYKKYWTKSIIKDSIPWINLWDGKGHFTDAVIKYGTVATPNFILISKDKKVLERWFGYREGIINEKLKKYLE